MEHYNSIFQYITSMETQYRLPVQINEKSWSMRNHIRRSDLHNNSDIEGIKTDFTPIKNITRPILNLQHRTEDIEVKDVQIYVNDPDKYHLSLLVKKYHDDVFTVENNIDAFFDELNISRIDFGGGLSKQLNKPCPEVVPLQSIAFCDQTDILSGPIGIKHFYSPDQLLEMESKGWGSEANGATATLQDVINLSREERTEVGTTGQTNKTPGRYIEVYEVHGNLPKTFADPFDTSGKYETRLFIVCFYQKKGSDRKEGIILYTALEKASPFKLIKRDPVYGRALGFGGAEELFEAQMWTNYDAIRMLNMLDAAATTILTSTDPAFTKKNKILNMQNMEVTDLAPGTEVKQLDTFPRNLRLFENSMLQWEQHAKDIGGSQDPLQGKEPTSGTPFASLQAQIQQGMGLHEYRRGQYAKHLEEIYYDWIIPHIERQICKGTKFLSELSLEELQYVADCLVRNQTEEMKKEYVLSNGGSAPNPEEVALYEQQLREDFKRKGNKHFIEILKGEFKGATLGVKVNIAGKSKSLASMVDKVTNIFRFAFTNPQGFAQVMQIPGMAKSFNQILEFSGLSPADFTGIEKLAMPPQAPQEQLPQPQYA